MPALSRPLSHVSPRYDVIVVGSGYGGGVAAARLAAAGRKVCVLERGRELRPGDFGDGSLTRLLPEVRMTGRKLRLGAPTALYDFRAGRDLHVVVANGLGGGSLINGAAALRPDMGVFARQGWPEPVAGDRHLAAAFERAERMLGVAPCPDVAHLGKLSALKRGADLLGGTFEPMPTTIRYEPGANAAGVLQYGCRQCGACWSGCNVGAKTTVGVSYLAEAVRHGAEIFTLASVHHVARHGAGWAVHVGDTEPKANGPLRRMLFAHAVVLAAGTLGTTEILLRSRARGLAVSDRLGQGFSANGDEMFIGIDMPELVNGVGLGFPPRAAGVAPVGPATAGMIRVRDEGWGSREVLIQDGTMLPMMARLAPLKSLLRMQPRRALAMLFEGMYAGHRARTAMLYAVSDDDAAGSMRLERDRLIVDWPDVAKQAFYARSEALVRRMVEGQGGTLLPNPLSERMFGSRKVTVHPLGGCGVGTDAATGVVDHAGRVFDSSSGSSSGSSGHGAATGAGSGAASTSAPSGPAVHEGLLVCDGSVMRGALGVNPLLTITALAERAMALLAEREGWRPAQAPAPAPAAPARDALM